MTDHRPVYVLRTSCGCVVFVRDGDELGRAKDDTKAGDMLRMERVCPLHGHTDVTVVTPGSYGADAPG